MRHPAFVVRRLAFAALLFHFLTPGARAQEPGVDVAAPRIALSTVDDVTVSFHPANPVVEQGDWVRWEHVGFSLPHTTTSGFSFGCFPGGLWHFELLPGMHFTRRFVEAPGTISYYCEPHCALLHTGVVVVTDPIHVTATDSLGVLGLEWTGGSPGLSDLYRIFRSTTAAFMGGSVQTLSPDVGDRGTIFTDDVQPGRGQVLFYLVMNKF